MLASDSEDQQWQQQKSSKSRKRTATGNTRQVQSAAAAPTQAAGLATLQQMCSGSADTVATLLQSALQQLADMKKDFEFRFKQQQNEIAALRQQLKEVAADQRKHQQVQETTLSAEETARQEDIKLNIIVHGIPQSDSETKDDVQDMVEELLKAQLQVPSVANRIKSVVRMPKRSYAAAVRNAEPAAPAHKPRPVLETCASLQDKLEVLKAKRQLKGLDVHVSIDTQLTPWQQQYRRQLLPRLQAARSARQHAVFRFGHRLFVEGKEVLP